jgi:hypothetical protein
MTTFDRHEKLVLTRSPQPVLSISKNGRHQLRQFCSAGVFWLELFGAPQANDFSSHAIWQSCGWFGRKMPDRGHVSFNEYGH